MYPITKSNGQLYLYGINKFDNINNIIKNFTQNIIY